MAFWDWLNENYEHTGERFGYAKRITVGVIVFLLVPMLIYFLITWDPTIGMDEDGEPVKLGVYVVIGLYWLGAYFAYKSHERKVKLNHLMENLFDAMSLKVIYGEDLYQINQPQTLSPYRGELGKPPVSQE